MKGELYRRWLIEGRDLTLEEFVAERRAEVRQRRAQRWRTPQYLALLQQGSQQAMLRQGAWGNAMGGLGNPFGGALQWLNQLYRIPE